MAAFCVGTVEGWTSPVQPILESEDSPIGVALSRSQFSWLGSLNFIGGIVGTLFWGRLSDGIGRKRTGLAVALPFAIGWALLLAARNEWMLYVGRFFVGIGCCGTYINTPIFVTEISQNEIRGALGSFFLLNANLGSLLSYIEGALCSYQVLTGTCLALVVLYFSLFLLIPDSPGSLLVKKKRAEALTSMTWYRGGDQVLAERDLSDVEKRLIKPQKSYKMLFKSSGRIKGLMIGVVLIIGQVACGMRQVTTYAVTIFKEAGSSLTPHQSAIILGCLQVVASICSLTLVDKLGRKVMLITSFTTMGVSLCSLAAFYYFKASISSTFLFIPVAALSINVIAFSVGAGPLPFLVMSEMLPPEIRGTAISLAQLIKVILSFVNVKIFPWLNATLGSAATFAIFGVASLVLPLFVLFVVPETSGKTLHSILRRLEGDKDETEEYVAPGTKPIRTT